MRTDFTTVGCAFQGSVEGAHTRPNCSTYALFYMRAYEGPDGAEIHEADQGSDGSVAGTIEGAVDGSDT